MTPSAEKLRFLPPLTTLVTRLMATTCSLRLRLAGSIRFAITMKLELQSRGAGCVSQRLHAAMIMISAAIEHHLFDAFFLGALGHQGTDRLGCRDIPAIGFGA